MPPTIRPMRFVLAALAAATLVTGAAAAQSSFVNFETPHVHPIAMNIDNTVLAVCNTADNRVELFDVTSGTPTPIGSVPVGLDPVSAFFYTETELWVVNQISDTISIVDIASMSVIDTIDTLDEPADIVIVAQRAFVTCSQVDIVQVFTAVNREPLAEIEILGEDPRAMALSPDRNLLYVAIFESGNRSTLLSGGLLNTLADLPNVVNNPDGPYGGVNPPPNVGNSFVPPQEPTNPAPPRVGLIVKQNDAGQWMDDNTGNWTEFVSGARSLDSGRVAGWEVLDNDVAVIDIASLTVVDYIEGLMNACMAIAVNPISGQVTVVGTDATNEIRFEPVINGTFLRVNLGIASPAVRGALPTATIVDLNPHLTYSVPAIAQAERDKSIGDPRGIVWNASGTRGYVTGMGSNNVIAIDAAGGRAGTLPIEVGEGPTGLLLDEARSRLYVLNKFAASISVIDTNTDTVVSTVPFFDPTPLSIRIGRKHLYDTHKNSGLGHIACGSCHIDARMDRMAWDLGNPSGGMAPVNSENQNLGAGVPLLESGIFGLFPFEDSHPMKGPMTTQTLQDIIGKEPLHWRADKRGLEDFNGAFVGLQGGDDVDPGPAAGGLTDIEMQEFSDFLATLHFQPNPFRNFDNTLPTNLELPYQFSAGRFAGAGGLQKGDPMPPGNAQRGLALYMGTIISDIDAGLFNCVTCHTLPLGNGADTFLNGTIFEEFPRDENGNNHVAVVSVDQSTNLTIKTPQLRNIIEKTGMDFLHPVSRAGFGFLHDGSIDTVSRFLASGVFDPGNDQNIADMVALLFAFSGSDFGNPTQAPIPGLLESPVSLQESKDAHASVGKQITIDSPVPTAEELTILNAGIGLAETGAVDLVARGLVNGVNRGWLLLPSAARGAPAEAVFQSDSSAETILESDLIAQAGIGTEITFTAVPTGSGRRIALDRDEDGFLDFDETSLGSDPADKGSVPTLCDLSDNIADQYAVLVETLTLDADADADGLPEDGSLALIRHTACFDESTALGMSAAEAFRLNLEAFDAEVLLRTHPELARREAIAALMMVSESLQAVLLSKLADTGANLTGEYLVVTCAADGSCEPIPNFIALRGLAPGVEEPFSGAADPNGDGETNAEEYQATVVDAGGTLEEFALAALAAAAVDGNANNSDGICFIATAAYGTPLAEEIGSLRAFRDTRMLTNAFGAAFTDTYYRLSPPIADLVAANPLVASLVRTAITLVLHAAQALAFLLLVSAALGLWSVRRLRIAQRGRM